MKRPNIKKRQLRSRSRVLSIAVLIILQIAFLILLLGVSLSYFRFISIVLQIVSVIVCVFIFNKTGKTAYKLTWIFLIMLVPLFGGFFYLIFYIQSNPRKYRRLIKKFRLLCKPFFPLSSDKLPLLANEPCYALARYLQNYAHYPVYTNTQAEYLSSGESYYQRLLEELQKAERYIFIEVFIIEEGAMFDALFAILAAKAKAGLDIRVLYDDFGCLSTLSDDFGKNLERAGIKNRVFNPFKPVLSSLQNNRDHRKIISIDGKTAFTGGINIADEYINAYQKYGRWKDSGICLTGEAAWSLTMIFLRLWNIEAALHDKTPHDDFAAFCPSLPPAGAGSDGFIQPYAESPVTKEYVCENVYIHIINASKKYLYINTPYLIPDETLFAALLLAAKSGTDVRIIMPHIPDKWLVHLVSRSYYRLLIKAGVRIFEYTEGFNHSKTFVCDDTMATVGTANLDFRSLCLHYECGVFIYRNSQILKMKDDFLATLEQCKEFRLKDCARNTAHVFLQDILRIFAPLM